VSKKEDTKALLRGHVITINRCNIFHKRRMIVDKVNNIVKLVLEFPVGDVNLQNLESDRFIIAQVEDVRFSGNH
jgi:hypothetical protein